MLGLHGGHGVGSGSGGGWLHLHYLAAGYMFAWSIAGPDPAPRRPGLPVRVTVLVAAAAAHSVLAKVLYGQAAILPMSHGQDVEAVQQAARLMYYGGDLAEVLLATVMFSSWFSSRAHRRRRARLTGAGMHAIALRGYRTALR